MAKKEHFKKQAELFADETRETPKEKSQTRRDYLAGCKQGYQYAVKRSDNVIKLIVRMAKKDIAFTEEEAVKFYHGEMRD